MRFLRRLRRLWCLAFHAKKTEQVAGPLYRRRCLECSEVFLFDAQEARNIL